MSYAPVQTDLTRRAATDIDRILKGDKPASLPVEQASNCRLVINLGTERHLVSTYHRHYPALAGDLID